MASVSANATDHYTILAAALYGSNIGLAYRRFLQKPEVKTKPP